MNKRLLCLLLLISSSLMQPLLATAGDVLCRLKERSEQSRTDSLLVYRQGKPVFEYRLCEKPQRIDCLNLSRPIMALAIGILVNERYIMSLDTPISAFCSTNEPSPSIRTLLSAQDDTFYDLGKVVKSISGLEWSDYIQVKLFSPLGISSDCWIGLEDEKKRLSLTAEELAKIGLLIARKGEFRGKQLLSCKWVQSLQAPRNAADPFMSMQWFLEYFDFSTYWDQNLINLYICKGVDNCLIARLKALQGRVIHFGGLAVRGQLIHGWGHDVFCGLGGQEALIDLIAQTNARELPLGHFSGGSVKSIVAWGTGGQQLIIMPSRQLVAVRQTTHLSCEDTFEDLIEVLDDYAAQVECYLD